MNTIKPRFQLFYTILFACIVLMQSLPAQPKIFVDNTSLDAGKIFSGDIYNPRWIIKNIGNETLTITNVHPSCGCTSARIPKSNLAPGEFDTLIVKFNSSGFHGKISKYIEISSNDPQKSSLVLSFTGVVETELEPLAGSETVWLGNVMLGKEIQQSVKYRNTSTSPITVYEFSSSDKNIHLASRNITVNPADTLNIPIIILPNKEGYTSESLQLQTSSKKQSSLTIPISYSGIVQK
jgi:hypothetical protein